MTTQDYCGMLVVGLLAILMLRSAWKRGLQGVRKENQMMREPGFTTWPAIVTVFAQFITALLILAAVVTCFVHTFTKK